MLQWVFWLPCLFPVVLVGGLCIAALVRQVRSDRKSKQPPDEE